MRVRTRGIHVCTCHLSTQRGKRLVAYIHSEALSSALPFRCLQTLARGTCHGCRLIVREDAHPQCKKLEPCRSFPLRLMGMLLRVTNLSTGISLACATHLSVEAPATRHSMYNVSHDHTTTRDTAIDANTQLSIFSAHLRIRGLRRRGLLLACHGLTFSANLELYRFSLCIPQGGIEDFSKHAQTSRGAWPRSIHGAWCISAVTFRGIACVLATLAHMATIPHTSWPWLLIFIAP